MVPDKGDRIGGGSMPCAEASNLSREMSVSTISQTNMVQPCVAPVQVTYVDGTRAPAYVGCTNDWGSGTVPTVPGNVERLV